MLASSWRFASSSSTAGCGRYRRRVTWFAAATDLGYCYAPYQVEVEHWFCKPSFAFRTHHLHLIPVGTPQWLRSLAFRDYLRAHGDVAAEYEVLKRRLALEHRLDREAYTLAKRPFINRITDVALEIAPR